MAIPTATRRIVLKENVKGMITPEHFSIETSPVPIVTGSDLLVQVYFFSVDPYLRGRVGGGPGGFAVGSPIANFAVGKVVQSANPSFAEGEFVTGVMSWEEYTVVKDGKGVRKVDVVPGVPLSNYVGLLGMPGTTAYFGLLDIGDPKPGETVYVSAASGAVGQVVGQIAKLKGCRVVGSAGSADKVQYLTDELGFDAAFNYKEEPDLTAALRRTCPTGIDVYFENVGGAMLDAVLEVANKFARVPVCGMISQYNLEKKEPVYNLILTIYKSIKLQGFVVADYTSRVGEFFNDATAWVKEGKLKYKEHVYKGFEVLPEALVGLFHGSNFGKAVVQVVSDDILAA